VIVTVSVNYADFLVHTLPFMKAVDDVTVVTHPDDHETIGLCKESDIKMHQTKVFYKDHARFDKAAAISEAIKGMSGWVLLLDADILIPKTLKYDGLDQNKLYTYRRRLIESPNGLRAFYQGKRDFREFQVGRNGYCGEHNNWVGLLGYFQLFHANNLPAKYLGSYRDASTYDVVFGRRWTAEDRQYIPGYVYHLGQVNKNWRGRKTPRFEVPA